MLALQWPLGGPGHLVLCCLCAGASAMLECLAFKSTRHRDSMRIMQAVRAPWPPLPFPCSSVVMKSSKSMDAVTI
jgi:hypothetical protein